MKKTILVVSVLAFVALASCKNENKKINPTFLILPQSVGEDCFAGRTFATESSRLIFGMDGRVEVSSIQLEGLGEETFLTKDFLADYSFNSEKKELYLCARKMYANEKLMDSLDDFVESRMVETRQEIDSMIREGILKIDGTSKKIYESIIKKSYESQARSVLESTIEYKYNLSDDSIILDLTEMPPKTARGSEMEGNDQSEKYMLQLLGNEMVIAPEDMDVESSTVYFAFVEWDQSYESFQGTVYSVFSQIDEEAMTQEVVCKDLGPLKGKLKFTTEPNEGFYFYIADVDFTSVPSELKDLKQASLSDAMLDVNESYTLIAGPGLENLEQ